MRAEKKLEFKTKSNDSFCEVAAATAVKRNQICKVVWHKMLRRVDFYNPILLLVWIGNYLKEILIENGFIEKMRTTRGKKKLPWTFFHNFRFSWKYDLISLTLNQWQPCISQFRDITKRIILQKFS